MITHEEVVLLVEKNPNDMKLGEKIRQLYSYDQENPYRNEDNLPDLSSATDHNPEGTSVTSIDDQMEEVWKQLEFEELQRFPGNSKRDYTLNPELHYHSKEEFKETIHGYDANGSPVEEEIDTTIAYTRNPHPRTGI